MRQRDNAGRGEIRPFLAKSLVCIRKGTASHPPRWRTGESLKSKERSHTVKEGGGNRCKQEGKKRGKKELIGDHQVHWGGAGTRRCTSCRQMINFIEEDRD